jgi:hypothetical protein
MLNGSFAEGFRLNHMKVEHFVAFIFTDATTMHSATNQK